MQVPAHIFREYDIRGVADKDLSSELVRAIGRELGAMFLESGPKGRRLRVPVGRDCRLSSDRIYTALVDGLIRSGIDVVDIGLGPTPMLYFAVHHLDADGGVMITGSHNPGEEN